MPSSKAWVTAPIPSQPACRASTTALIVSTPITGWKTGIGGGPASVTDAPEVTVGRTREEELAGDAVVDRETVSRLQELPHRRLGVVALAPSPVREQIVRQV